VSRPENAKTVQQIEQWMATHLEGLPSDQVISCLLDAIEAVLTRTLATLSEVTLNAVLDRVLLQVQAKQTKPIKLSIKNFKFERQELTNEMAKRPDEVIAALRCFLIELFSIINNLTAGILSELLYQELRKMGSKNSTKISSDRRNT